MERGPEMVRDDPRPRLRPEIRQRLAQALMIDEVCDLAVYRAACVIWDKKRDRVELVAMLRQSSDRLRSLADHMEAP